MLWIPKVPQTVEIIINEAHKEGVYLLCTSGVCLVPLKILRRDLQGRVTTPNPGGEIEMHPNIFHIPNVTIAGLWEQWYGKQVRICPQSALAILAQPQLGDSRPPPWIPRRDMLITNDGTVYVAD